MNAQYEFGYLLKLKAFKRRRKYLPCLVAELLVASLLLRQGVHLRLLGLHLVEVPVLLLVEVPVLLLVVLLRAVHRELPQEVAPVLLPLGVRVFLQEEPQVLPLQEPLLAHLEVLPHLL